MHRKKIARTKRPRIPSPPILAPAAGTIAADRPPSTSPEPLLTAHDVASLLRISRSGVYQLVRGGHLPSLKIGYARRFRDQDVREFMLHRVGPVRSLRVQPTFLPPLEHG